ncbi:MAG: hypothetical protein M1834_000042 [Cirrosporium novae-zelandiae]|nr:MAG: hypothetical protein M1834_000042 [Cirrosporium novae-zelandiae]
MDSGGDPKSSWTEASSSNPPPIERRHSRRETAQSHVAESPNQPQRPRNHTASTYGSVGAYDNVSGQPSAEGSGTAPQSPYPKPSRSRESSTSHPRQSATPEFGPVKQSKKPLMNRRISKLHVPHKGQEFSVDDAPGEFEKDLQLHRQTSSVKAASGFGVPLRREPSTLRRRPTGQPAPGLPRVDSQEEEEQQSERRESTEIQGNEVQPSSGEETITAAEEESPLEDDADVSDAESFTLKDRQEAINTTHPFGIRIWKPALYKKNRSVQRTAEGDIHSSPGGRVSKWLWFFNFLWSVLFGWWLALVITFSALICFLAAFSPGATDYGRVFLGLAKYILYPFGQFVRLDTDEAYMEEDEGEGRSISEYERWQTGDLEDGRLFFGPVVGRRRNSVDSASEHDSLLGRSRIGDGDDHIDRPKSKRRFFGRGEWTLARVVFYLLFYVLVAPFLLLVSGLCWLMVFWIPMGKVTIILFRHLRRHPLALSFHTDATYSRQRSTPTSSILLCTYRAVGSRYWKYTVDGTNIFLINLLSVVLFTIFDYWVLDVSLGIKSWVTNPGFVFTLALFSVTPLAYFIGQAVASISAQSSMGLGAAINAFFSTIVEVFLYCVALNQGKSQLVEGSVIGSIFAGILLLPGISMCSGAIKRKTQRFNVKSAGVTTTMLLFAVIGAFGPTLFYQIYGSHQLNCHACTVTSDVTNRDCRRCYYSQTPAINDRFFIEAVQPYCFFAAVLLFLSYLIGLWFTLRTHAATIWNSEADEKKAQGHEMYESRNEGGSLIEGLGNSSIRHNSLRESQLYKRILGNSLKQISLNNPSMGGELSRQVTSTSTNQPPYIVPPKTGDDSTKPTEDNTSQRGFHIAGLSDEENRQLIRQVTEIAATAATAAARDITRAPKKTAAMSQVPADLTLTKTSTHRTGTTPGLAEHDDPLAAEAAAVGQSGGHDAPNWSRTKSSVILLGATILYAIIAEVLVNTVDTVLESVDIDEKFLGITLFALVPNTTEFLNAISFAMNGNIALSMEIGSAYALQVCLLQIPALVLFSAVHERWLDPTELVSHTFNLLFPQWDMITVILCVFLLSYMYGEGKSNYFKGSILVLTYLVVIMGFYFSGYSQDIETMAASRFPEVPVSTVREDFWTVGRGVNGRAF